MNLCIQLGNLTRDPKMSRLPSGTQVSKFGLANSYVWINKEGEKVEQTLFLDCEAFGKTAQNVTEYCKKGRQILVKGRLRYDHWETSDGVKHSKVLLVAERVTFLWQPQRKAGDEVHEAYGEERPNG